MYYTLGTTLLLWLCTTLLSGAALDQLPDACALGTDQLPKMARAHYRYTQSGHLETQRMLERLPRYRPAMEKALAEHGLPGWLQFITLAESRLDPVVTSAAGAAGLWQLMPATARAYGLAVNGHTDERQDPLLSSRAAAKLLADLHRQFDDWLLVLAAYNCGPTRLKRIIQRTGRRDYAGIAHLLPGQTQRYIPRVLTIAAIAMHPACYGFSAPEPAPTVVPAPEPLPAPQKIQSVRLQPTTSPQSPGEGWQQRSGTTALPTAREARASSPSNSTGLHRTMVQPRRRPQAVNHPSILQSNERAAMVLANSFSWPALIHR
jgi:hypothetical protein